MNIPQLRSSVLKIKKRMDGPSGQHQTTFALYALVDLVENMIDAMGENEKGILVNEVSIAGETWRTYLTKRSPEPKKEEKKTKRQRALDSLVKHAESLDW